MNKTIFVFAHIHAGDPVISGILEYNELARIGIFRYVKSYLSRPEAIPLSMQAEFALTPSLFGETRNEGLPGPIRDAMPDYWGRLVFASRHAMPLEKVSNTDILLADVEERAGFLDFSDTPEWQGRRAADVDIPLIKDVDLLVNTADALSTHQPIAEYQQYVLRLLAQGTSMGGARPKSVIRIENELWLAKFPAREDRFDVSAVEYAVHKMARDAGITVPEIRLLPLADGRHVFLSKRFDRLHDLRIPMVSALTALHLDESENARGGYPAIAAMLKQQGDLLGSQELFSRMVFNVFIRNTDDHLRNHAFLYDRALKAWKLSPAYDVNPGVSRLGIGSEFDLSINVGAYGRSATLQNIVSDLDSFGMDGDGAFRVIHAIRDVVANWQSYFKIAQVDSRTTQLFADTFDNSLQRFGSVKANHLPIHRKKGPP